MESEIQLVTLVDGLPHFRERKEPPSYVGAQETRSCRDVRGSMSHKSRSANNPNVHQMVNGYTECGPSHDGVLFSHKKEQSTIHAIT